MNLYRNMRRDGDRPVVGPGGLVIRPGVDVETLDCDEEVSPEGGGLSTAPGNPLLLPVYRRPLSLGGTSKHPVWSIPRGHLPPYRLTSRTDSTTHETVLPAEAMTLKNFESHLHDTVQDWRLTHE